MSDSVTSDYHRTIDVFTKARIGPGAVIREFWGVGNMNNRTVHVRAVVDEQVVFRVWLKHKRIWRYDVVSQYSIGRRLREGRAKVVRR